MLHLESEEGPLRRLFFLAASSLAATLAYATTSIQISGVFDPTSRPKFDQFILKQSPSRSKTRTELRLTGKSFTCLVEISELRAEPFAHTQSLQFEGSHPGCRGIGAFSVRGFLNIGRPDAYGSILFSQNGFKKTSDMKVLTLTGGIR